MPLLSRWNNRRGDQTAAFWHVCFTLCADRVLIPLIAPLFLC